MLAVGLVQVGAEVLAGHGGRRRGEDGGRGAAGHAASSGGHQAAAEQVAAEGVAHQVRQHVLEVVLVQGHALQQVVEQLRRHRGIDARTAGHEHVDLVHALDVAGGEPLAGFLVERVSFCKKEQSREVLRQSEEAPPGDPAQWLSGALLFSCDKNPAGK